MEGRAEDYCGAIVLFNCEQAQVENNFALKEEDSITIQK
jgi:hypothetical protein